MRAIWTRRGGGAPSVPDAHLATAWRDIRAELHENAFVSIRYFGEGGSP
jgi:hypothetical protein